MTPTDKDTWTPMIAELQRLRDAGERMPTDRFPAFPEMGDAMDLQDRVMLHGHVEDAWKVARAPDGAAVTARLHPLIEQNEGAVLPFRAGTLLEVEFAVRLAADLPVRETPHQRADILAAIDGVYLGAELVWSALAENGKVSFPLFLVDRLGNDGYVLGPQLGAEVLDPAFVAQLTIRSADGTIFDASAKHATDDVLTWLIDFANRTDRPAGSLKAGALITTGSLCGGIPLAEGGRFEIDLSGAPAFDLSLQ